MANLMDYLDWRGDLTLEISPFNEGDALILAELSFVDFDGIVPPPELGRGLPLNEAAEAFFARHGMSFFARNAEEAARFADRLVYDGKAAARMLEAQRACMPRDGAEKIVRIVEERM